MITFTIDIIYEAGGLASTLDSLLHCKWQRLDGKPGHKANGGPIMKTKEVFPY